jgi:NADH:ubiquinone oxidoreductase subunit F (NADH-binding)
MKILQKTNLEAWKKAKVLGPEGVIELLEKKGLVGRGGACFPTGTKWKFTRQAKGDEKFVICNADEGEPGTFKDKLLLEQVPENVIEGIMIASFVVGAKQAYIYLRGEYYYLKKKLEEAIDKILKEANSDLKIDVIEGAGAYICGDETAIISSIENKRGYPTFKPPYPPQKGLFDMPTAINNTETLASVPLAIINDDWKNGLRLFSVSGDVSKPGVYEIDVGAKMKDIAELAGAKEPKAVYFGASGGCMPYKGDFQVNYDHVCKEEVSLGACSLIFVSKKRSMLDLALSIAHFFKHESCGKCTPCREGNLHILKMLEKIKAGQATKADMELLEKTSIFIRDNALCGLGQSCTSHVLSAIKFFKEDFKVK